MSLLLTPITIGNHSYRNRIAMSPMCQYSAEDGFANDWHFVHLGSRAVGGVGLVMQEATAVSAIGRISPADLGLWKDEHQPALKRIVDFVHLHQAKIGIQLAHAGRKCSTSSLWTGTLPIAPEDGGWVGVAPSAITFREGFSQPKALSIDEIQEIVQQFKTAAIRAVEIGYDVIEIHAGHGYLLHEFLSPISNHRTDEYGGSLENRSRFLIECVRAIREVMRTDMNLFVRLSAIDYLENGWDIQQSIALSKILKAEGVHLVDASSGAIAPGEKIEAQPNYQVSFAAAIKKEAGIATAAVGLILTPKQAEEILQKEEADMVFLGRELLRNPYFALQAAVELDGENIFPDQYIRGFHVKKK